MNFWYCCLPIGWISFSWTKNSPGSFNRHSGDSKIVEISIRSQQNIFVEPAIALWRVEGAGPTFQSITAVIFGVSREDWTSRSFHRSSAVHLRLVDYQSVYAERVLPVASPSPLMESLFSLSNGQVKQLQTPTIKT